MTNLSAELRLAVAERARYRCEYCQTQADVVIYMVIDHIRPRSADGSNDLNNLCYACPSCNQYKREMQQAIDPQTEVMVALFNPRQDEW